MGSEWVTVDFNRSQGDRVIVQLNDSCPQATGSAEKGPSWQDHHLLFNESFTLKKIGNNCWNDINTLKRFHFHHMDDRCWQYSQCFDVLKRWICGNLQLEQFYFLADLLMMSLWAWYFKERASLMDVTRDLLNADKKKDKTSTRNVGQNKTELLHPWFTAVN